MTDFTYPPLDGLTVNGGRFVREVLVQVERTTWKPRVGHWVAELAHALHHRIADLQGIDTSGCPGVHVPSLATLSIAEVMELRPVFAAGADVAEEGISADAEAWLSRLLGLLSDEVDGRLVEQALVDARAAAMAAEELRRDRASRLPTDLTGIPPHSQIDRDPKA